MESQFLTQNDLEAVLKMIEALDVHGRGTIMFDCRIIDSNGDCAGMLKYVPSEGGYVYSVEGAE